MKKISLLNPYSFYYLWNTLEGKDYLTKVVNDIISENNNYELINLFNEKKNRVRSYVVLEADNTIVFIDFNFEKNNKLFKIDLLMNNYLKYTSTKKVKLIIFNNYIDFNCKYNNYYDIYIDKNNSKDIKLFFANNYIKQYLLNPKITNILYKMDKKTYDLYLHENKLKKNLL